MLTEGARTYSNVVRLEVPATLIFPIKQIQKTSETLPRRDESATIINFSEAALKAANGHVSTYHEAGNSNEAKQPSQELVADKNGRTRIVVTFYGRNGEAVLTIPPKDSMSSDFFIEDEKQPLDIAA
jgi:hypothetical protein